MLCYDLIIIMNLKSYEFGVESRTETVLGKIMFYGNAVIAAAASIQANNQINSHMIPSFALEAGLIYAGAKLHTLEGTTIV